MTKRDIAQLACKILSLYLLVQVGLQVVTYFGGLVFLIMGLLFESGAGGWTGVMAHLLYMISPVLTILIAIVLWKKAEAISARMVVDDPTPVTRADINSQTVLSILMVAIGLFLFVTTLGQLVSDLYFILTWREPYPSPSGMQQHAELVNHIIVMGCSLWLIFGSRGIIRLIHWTRSAGTTPVEAA